MSLNPLDQGFVDRCAQHGVTDPNAVQTLMKTANDMLYTQQQVMQKQAMSPATRDTLLGALAGGGLGAGISGLTNGWESALYGGLGGAGLGAGLGYGYGKYYDTPSAPPKMQFYDDRAELAATPGIPALSEKDLREMDRKDRDAYLEKKRMDDLRNSAI